MNFFYCWKLKAAYKMLKDINDLKWAKIIMDIIIYEVDCKYLDFVLKINPTTISIKVPLISIYLCIFYSCLILMYDFFIDKFYWFDYTHDIDLIILIIDIDANIWLSYYQNVKNSIYLLMFIDANLHYFLIFFHIVDCNLLNQSFMLTIQSL